MFDHPLPPFLRVEEVANLLRISRSSAYERVNEYLATNGERGIPVVRIGRSLRVPRNSLEAFFASNVPTPPNPITRKAS